ncbi:MAG: hypothetical protein AB7H97_21820 [Pseudobdellovibrionaceae bacterium]
MAKTETRTHLEGMSRSLTAVHKSLIHVQKEILEQQTGRAYAPHEVLNIAFSHPDFEWLLKISSLIVRIDEKVDKGTDDEIEKFSPEMTREIYEMFIDPGQWIEIKKKMMEFINHDSNLMFQLSDLRKFLVKKG